jgi:hypothetical protein
VIILAIGGYFIFVKQSSAPITTSAPAQVPEAATVQPTQGQGSLSEQPNKAKYDEYLSDIYLGKMAIGKKIGADGFPVKTNIFTAGTDLFCTMMQLKKTIVSGHIVGAIYDTVAKQDNQPKTAFPMELKAGGSGGCSDLSQPVGKYEDKIYIDDVLAAVLPFEVK